MLGRYVALLLWHPLRMCAGHIPTSGNGHAEQCWSLFFSKNVQFRMNSSRQLLPILSRLHTCRRLPWTLQMQPHMRMLHPTCCRSCKHIFAPCTHASHESKQSPRRISLLRGGIERGRLCCSCAWSSNRMDLQGLNLIERSCFTAGTNMFFCNGSASSLW